MTLALNRVVIVGGGSAGWLAAARLRAEYPESLSVTVLESPDVPIIGVGEGTWPSMRTTLQKIGLSERDLIKACDASFKQGTWFKQWRTGALDDQYQHPFTPPAEFGAINLGEFWSSMSGTNSFAQTVTPQADAVMQSRAPKRPETPDYHFLLNYGYHFDAAKFAQLVSRHAVEQLGVVHCVAHVERAICDDNGNLKALELREGAAIEADLFIDCTGMRGLLIKSMMHGEWRSLDRVSSNNRAVVAQVPYASPEADIASCTLSTAQDYGWIWDIGLQSRRGVGYVHDAQYLSEDAAADALRAYVSSTQPGFDVGNLIPRTINFSAGYIETPWIKNCVAIGLSAGFIEPMEASALVMVEQAIDFLVNYWPTDAAALPLLAGRFNQKMTTHWQEIADFLQLHYVLSERRDTPYWRAVADRSRCSETLQELLAIWQFKTPWIDDIARVDALFPAASYQYIYLGMAAKKPKAVLPRSKQDMAARADQSLHRVREASRALVGDLPSHRALLSSLHA